MQAVYEKKAELFQARGTSDARQVLEQTLFWSFVAALAWCPFLFGSVGLGAWGINAIVFCGLASAYEIFLFMRGESHPVGVRNLSLPFALFAAVICWIVVQASVWLPTTIQHPIWGMARVALDTKVLGSISVNRDLTILALMRLVTIASAFWLALQMCRKAVWADLLIMAIAAIACVYAVYGLITYFVAPDYVLWLNTSSTVTGFVRSTFINPNSYATYGGIGFVTICGVILQMYRRNVPNKHTGLKFRISTLIDATGGFGAALLGGALLVLVAVLLTGSRAGSVTMIGGIVILGLLMFGVRVQGRASRIEMVIFIAILMLAVFVIFGDVFVDKIAKPGVSGQNRLAAYAITTNSILAAPFLGYGYGTFADIFPMYRDQSISVLGVWRNAYNTYLEILQGLGVLFGSALVISILLLVLRCTKGAIMRLQNNMIPAVAASVAFVVGAHALVDSSLQTQSVALTFAALLGAGVAQSTSSRESLTD